MARDPLAVLWRVRVAAVEAATRDLALALAEERAATARVEAHAARMGRERDAARGDLAADFAAWLPQAVRHAEQLRAVLSQAQALVARRRDILVARRTEAEAIAKARERQSAAAASLRGRRDQAIIDEIAAGRRPPRDMS